MRKADLLAILALVAALPAAAYDANGVALGGDEAAIKKAFPSARCKPLEWSSRAADRRCDDGEVALGGIEGRITFYLKGGTIEAFDVIFATQDAKRMAEFLKGRYGAPASEVTDQFHSRGKPPREVYKVRWDKGAEHALLSAQLEKGRSRLSVWRGNFDEEIYRVR